MDKKVVPIFATATARPSPQADRLMVSFPQMVQNLFEPMGSTPATIVFLAGRLVGAAGGILSTSSARAVTDLLGTMEFQMEAMFQTLGGRHRYRSEMVNAFENDFCKFQTFATVAIALVSVSANLLTQAIDLWSGADGKTLSEEEEKAMFYSLYEVRALLEVIRRLQGVSLAAVLQAIQERMAKDFPDKVFLPAELGAEAGAREP